ncbi:MAG: alpha/beta fold hydrolase [Thermoplasmata archaeon]
MPTADRSGSSIYYEVHGDAGDPTVLVHGSWVDHQSWERIVGPLSAGLRVVTFDRRGHGASTGAPRNRPVRDDASDLASLLETTDLFPAHLVGHSYGGVVALRLAIDRPELARSVTVHEPPFLGLLEDGGPLASEAAEARTQVRRLQRKVRSGDPEGAAREFMERFAPEPGAWERLDPPTRARTPRNAACWAEEFDDPETLAPSRAELAGLDLPVLLTTGERSSPLFRGIEGELAATMRNSTARTLRGAGHVPHLTHPEMYAGVVATFLLERDVPST